MTRPENSGFIALTSAIIIAAILLLVAATGGLTGIFARGDALDSELKARSLTAADACANEALLSLANDQTYAGGDKYRLNALDECRIGAVSTHSATYPYYFEFHIQATSSNAAVTDLDVRASTSDLTVLSWHEITSF